MIYQIDCNVSVLNYDTIIDKEKWTYEAGRKSI